jgi:hypothetical protein
MLVCYIHIFIGILFLSRRSKRECILVWILFMNTRRELGLHAKILSTHTHLSAVLFRLLAKEARTKNGECSALV